VKTLFEGQPVSSLRPEESQLLWTQCWQSKRTAGVNLAYLFATDSLKATGQQVPEKLRFFSPHAANWTENSSANNFPVLLASS
jgi:hypothetical protein